MKLNIENFDESEYFSFKTDIEMWKQNTEIFINFPEKADKKEYLNNYLELIKKELLWIQNNKSNIGEFLIENDCLELAENWASSAPLLECSEEECYIMEDGQKVFIPITPDDFLESLYLESITLNFKKNKEFPSLELILLCNPDYFAGHCLILNIYEDKKLVFNNLAG